MTTADSVRVTTLVAVDAARAFRVFTEDIGAWWKPKVPHLFRADRKGSLQFTAGPKGKLVEVYAEAPDDPFEVGRITAWDPPRRLEFEWRQRLFGPGDVTWVEVLFEPEDGGTRVTVEHRGWHRLADDHPARHGMRGEAFSSMIGLRWADLLVAMAVRLQ